MKVILLEDVRKQGKKDQIIDVSDGYAKNFLIKNKLAVPYTKTSENILNRELGEKALNESLLIQEMSKLKEKLEKEKIVFSSPSGKDGRLFGTISTKQIKEKISSLGYDIKKSTINIKNPINSLGVHNVEIVLHKKVIANVKIHVVSDK